MSGPKLTHDFYFETASSLIANLGSDSALILPGLNYETETTNAPLERAATAGGLGQTATFGAGNQVASYTNVADVHTLFNSTPVEIAQFGHVRSAGTGAVVTGIEANGTVDANLAAAGAQSATRSNFSVDFSFTGNSPNYLATHEFGIEISHIGNGTSADPSFDQTYVYKNGPQGYGGYNSSGQLVLGVENLGTPGYPANHIADSINVDTLGAFSGSSNLAAGSYVVKETDYQVLASSAATHGVQLVSVVGVNTVDYHLTAAVTT